MEGQTTDRQGNGSVGWSWNWHLPSFPQHPRLGQRREPAEREKACVLGRCIGQTWQLQGRKGKVTEVFLFSSLTPPTPPLQTMLKLMKHSLEGLGGWGGDIHISKSSFSQNVLLVTLLSGDVHRYYQKEDSFVKYIYSTLLNFFIAGLLRAFNMQMCIVNLTRGRFSIQCFLNFFDHRISFTFSWRIFQDQCIVGYVLENTGP